jgi:hypothetical protein
MELLLTLIITITVSIYIGILWVEGIDYMHKNYPDYKGEDLFDEDLSEPTKKPTKKK